MSEISDSSKKLSEIDVVSTLAADDLLIFERGQESFKIRYEDFKSYIASCLSSQLSVGSAALCNNSDFALFAHWHDYTDLSFFPSYGMNSPDPVLPVTSSYTIGKFEIIKNLPGYNEYSYNTITVDVPLKQTYIDNQLTGYNPHSIGDLLFIDTGNLTLEEYLTSIYGASLADYAGVQNIDINSQSFDGFVIPNGTTFSCQQNEFTDACKVFSSTKKETATRFTVPVLDSFFKVNPGLRKTDPTQKIPHHNAIVQHDHGGNINSNYTYSPLVVNTGQFKINTSLTKQSTSNHNFMANYVHYWMYDQPAKKKTIMEITKVSINAEVNSMNMKESGSTDEVYPPYDHTAVLMYIGVK